MSALPGTRLGPYELLAPLGAGGMGEVYRARDTRLGREVAIKVLPRELGLEPDRIHRLEREARAASAFNHPNILTVFDVGRQDGAPFLVTELLDGRTLREALRRDRLPVAKVVDLALQIGRGLAVAHAKGIVHRDLKPENLFLTKDDRVKILDFGLARLAQRSGGEEALSQLPTDTKQSLTEEGTVLGTVGYMAPEQVRGQPADARSDVFSLGAVLYEMLSGRRAFVRETAAETMTAILREEPVPLGEIRPEVPAALTRLLERCLAKPPEERFGSGREVVFALEVAGTTPSASSHAGGGATLGAFRGRIARLPVWLVAGVPGAALVAAALLTLRPPGERPVRRAPVVSSLTLPPGVGSLLSRIGTPDLALSPDGTRLAYTGVGQDRRPAIWIRELGSTSVRELTGTTNGLGPFWSPDSRLVGFFAEDKLRTVPADGGPVRVLCDAPESEGGRDGATWSRHGVILFSRAGSIARVPAGGGAPELVAVRDATEELLRYPSFLPDGRRFLYLAHRARGPSRTYVADLDRSQAPALLHERGSRAEVSASGHLIFVRDGALLAQPVDDRTLRTLGDPEPIATGVANHPGSGRAGFSVAESGRVVYAEAAGVPNELVWKDRRGRVLGKLTEEGRYLGAVLSPDGRRVAVEIEDAETGQHVVWILGPMPGVRSRLTHAPHDGHHPTWSPDGREIAFTSTRTGKWLPYRQRADGLGEDVLIHDQPDVSQLMVRQWTPDGRAVLAVAWEADGRPRLWLLPLDGSEKARPLVDGDWGALSRDGRWLAVATRHAGHHQVYVLPFPALDTRWQVSTEGGNWPRWRSDGGELFYVSEERKLMSVAVAAAPGFDAAPPTPLFPLSLRTRDRSSNYPHEYDVDAGGQRFVTCEVPDHVASPAIMLVTDWEALLGGR